ncbi:hypothetical protein ACFCZ5_19740 [Streptomyces microflavus]|uniref:hypothetical protein n=1 Tax=Streptomyces microflavus TaxID=1919 RepID=UPI0035E085D3
MTASAAACRWGSRPLPVYEVYKAGHHPTWLMGLDLLGVLGLPVAVIPHYDNTEGGTHDTRFCYLGEPRLAALEHELPDESAVLGIDEHTAVSGRCPEPRGPRRGHPGAGRAHKPCSACATRTDVKTARS